MPLSSKIDQIQRLKKRKDFLRVQKDGRKWISKGLIIEIAENDQNTLRVGFTVSKRVSKLAVDRNFIKRRLRSIAAEILPEYSAHSLDIVMVGRVSIFKHEYTDLKRDVVWCLRKLGIEPSSVAKKS